MKTQPCKTTEVTILRADNQSVRSILLAGGMNGAVLLTLFALEVPDLPPPMSYESCLNPSAAEAATTAISISPRGDGCDSSGTSLTKSVAMYTSMSPCNT